MAYEAYLAMLEIRLERLLSANKKLNLIEKSQWFKLITTNGNLT